MARLSCWIVLVLALLIGLAPGAAQAKTNGNPFFVMKGTTNGATFEYTFAFKDSTGKMEEVSGIVAAPRGITDEGLADTIKDQLNANDKVNKEYHFGPTFKSPTTGWWYVYGTPLPGKKPTAIKEMMQISPDVINCALAVGPGVDPLLGTAQWDIFSASGPAEPGEITLGVGNKLISTLTFAPGGEKSILTIKRELVNGLKSAGFLDSYIDPLTGFITSLNVTTGQPNTSDIGITFMTTDCALGGFAQLTVPEPSPLLALGLGALGLASLAWRCRWRKAIRFGPLLLLALCLPAARSSANTITVDRITYDRMANKYSINISGAGGSRTIHIFREVPQGGDVEVTPAGAMTTVDGKYSLDNINCGKSGYFRIEVDRPGGGKDTYKGIVRGDTGKKIESQEQKEARRMGMEEVRLNGLPFDFTNSVFVPVGTDLHDQFTLINLSPDTPYAFTSLIIYQDLDLAFFHPASFDSPSAIASGVLAEDLTGDPLGVAPSAGLSDPTLTFSIGPVRPDRYDLLVGTAAPILPDGSLGSPIGFAVGRTAVPEPGALGLLASLTVPGAIFLLRRRNRTC